MSTAAAFLDRARYYLALPTVENPLGSNDTIIGQNFGWNGVAWCAEFISVCLAESGLPCMHTASVYQASQSAKAGTNGLGWLGRDATLRPGDAACFDWGGQGNPADMHIAAVEVPNPDGTFFTIAGNENDRVMRQVRDRTDVMGFIRFPFAAPAPIPAPPPIRMMGEPDMAYRTFCRGKPPPEGTSPEFALVGGRVDALHSGDEKNWLVSIGAVVAGDPIPLDPSIFDRWFGALVQP